MKIWNKLLLITFRLLPYKLLSKMYFFVCKKDSVFKKLIEQVCNENFFSKSSIVRKHNKTINKTKKKKKYCIIKRVIWDHQYVNICFISEVMSLIIWCLENGFIPVIDIKTAGKNNENIWERMFKQPFNTNLNQIQESGDYIVCPFNTYLWPSMHDARDPEKVAFWHKMYKEFVVFNEECQRYIDVEYDSLIKGKKVLGCLIRGIEYSKCKAKNHPIQPSVEEFINKIRDVFMQDNLDYIYLATEDQQIANRIKCVFGETVIENKRQYYDDIYRNEGSKPIKEEFERKDGAFLKSLEYMSSINIVSKCDSLVAGLSGGSEAAEYFNGNKYKTNYLFDKGVY